MTAPWNPRFTNYARFHGRTPDEQLAHDRVEWKGGAMVGFILWNSRRLHEASIAIPRAFVRNSGLIDGAAFDAWLTAWVDAASAPRDTAVAA